VVSQDGKRAEVTETHNMGSYPLRVNLVRTNYNHRRGIPDLDLWHTFTCDINKA